MRKTTTAYGRIRDALRQREQYGYVSVSIPDLAALADCCERSAQRGLHALLDDGDLTLVEPARRHDPPVYRLAGSLLREVVGESS